MPSNSAGMLKLILLLPLMIYSAAAGSGQQRIQQFALVESNFFKIAQISQQQRSSTAVICSSHCAANPDCEYFLTCPSSSFSSSNRTSALIMSSTSKTISSGSLACLIDDAAAAKVNGAVATTVEKYLAPMTTAAAGGNVNDMACSVFLQQSSKIFLGQTGSYAPGYNLPSSGGGPYYVDRLADCLANCSGTVECGSVDFDPVGKTCFLNTCRGNHSGGLASLSVCNLAADSNYWFFELIL